MKVTIFGLGTQGDVRPLVALGVALRREGHEVRVAAQRCFAKLICEAGLFPVELSGDARGIADAVASDVVEGRLKFATDMRRMLADMAEPWAAEALAAVEGSELIISGTGAMGLAASVGEVTGVPLALAFLQPGGYMPQLPFVRTPVVNELLFLTEPMLWWYLAGAAVNRVRRTLGLKPYPFYGPIVQQRRRRVPIMYAFTRTLIRPRWSLPDTARITGYWTLDTAETWQPPTGVVDFLAAGPAPVYIGFGSMPDPDPEATAQLIVDALRKTTHRALISAGWAGLSDVRSDLGADRVLTIDEVPHDWLFPQVHAAVHHCGAGTCAAALRAGIPTVPVPFIFEQALWAQHLRQAGVATASLARPKLNAEGLADAINRTDAARIRSAAASLGRRVLAEEGTADAVRALIDWKLLR